MSTDYDIKPFICGLVMCILLVVVYHVISVLLSYSSVYILVYICLCQFISDLR